MAEGQPPARKRANPNERITPSAALAFSLFNRASPSPAARKAQQGERLASGSFRRNLQVLSVALLELQAATARARIVAPNVGERVVLVLHVGLGLLRRGLRRRRTGLGGALLRLMLRNGRPDARLAQAPARGSSSLRVPQAGQARPASAGRSAARQPAGAKAYAGIPRTWSASGC